MANRNGLKSSELQTRQASYWLAGNPDGQSMPARLKIYFDGGCRPTPGNIELAVVVRGVELVLRDQGFGTSIDAEWLALIEACRIARSLAIQPFIILGDCAPVIDQANGKAKVRGSSRAHREAFQRLVGGNPPQIR